MIGDGTGDVLCYEFKKGEPQLVFQIKPFDNNLPISSVTLGGDITKTDKIFIAQGHRIIGLTKTGKEFFKLTSALTEPIKNIEVDEVKIWTICENILNRYDDGNDAAYYMNRDKINCFIIDKFGGLFDVILGCQDNCIRIIRGSAQLIEIPLLSPVTAIAILQSNANTLHLIVGLRNGTLTHIVVDKPTLSVQYSWSLEDKDRSSICCIKLYNLDFPTKPRVSDSLWDSEVIIGREDGRLQVVCMVSGEADEAHPEGYRGAGKGEGLYKPCVGFTAELGESIMSMDCGVVNTVGCSEVS